MTTKSRRITGYASLALLAACAPLHNDAGEGAGTLDDDGGVYEKGGKKPPTPKPGGGTTGGRTTGGTTGGRTTGGGTTGGGTTGGGTTGTGTTGGGTTGTGTTGGGTTGTGTTGGGTTGGGTTGNGTTGGGTIGGGTTGLACGGRRAYSEPAECSGVSFKTDPGMCGCGTPEWSPQAGFTCGTQSAWGAKLMAEVNKRRANAGVSALRWDDSLAQGAGVTVSLIKAQGACLIPWSAAHPNPLPSGAEVGALKPVGEHNSFFKNQAYYTPRAAAASWVEEQQYVRKEFNYIPGLDCEPHYVTVMNPVYHRIGCAQTVFLEDQSVAVNDYINPLMKCLPSGMVQSVASNMPLDPDKILPYLLPIVERNTQTASCLQYTQSVRTQIATNTLARSYQYCHAVYCRLDY